MSELLKDGFEWGGPLSSVYQNVVNCDVVSDATLDGSYCVQSTANQIGPFRTPVLAPSGRSFHCSALLDHSRTLSNDGPEGTALFALEATEPAFGRRTAIQLFHRGNAATNTDLTVLDNSGGKDEFGVVHTGSVVIATLTDAYALGNHVTITFEGEFSTITGGTTWTAGGSAASDGRVSVQINGTEIYAQTGMRIGFLVRNGTGGQGWIPPSVANWETVLLTCQGRLDDLCIRDDTGTQCFDAVSTFPVNNSSICCGSEGVEASGVSAPGAGVKRPVLMSPAWAGRCDGAGAVALLADLTDAENWSDS